MEGAPPPVLAAGMEFSGLLDLPGPARIDGRVRGSVLAGGPVWIGPTGIVEADLEAESVVVAGQIRGDVRARTRIEVKGQARIRGDLRAPRVILADGAQVDGRCFSGDIVSDEGDDPQGR